MSVCPAKTQISLGGSDFTVRMKNAWVLSYPLSAKWRLWSDWADPSLRWAHSHFVGFVRLRLKSCNFLITQLFVFLRPRFGLELLRLKCNITLANPYLRERWLYIPTGNQIIIEPRHDKTNKVTVRLAKTQISLGIRPVWSESLLCAQWVTKDPSFLHADSEGSDQTRQMHRLIRVFAGHTVTLLVLPCRGSYYVIKWDKAKYFISIF